MRRLVTQITFAQVRISGGDIRRIGDDEVEALASQGGEPVGGNERDVVDREPRGIALRQRERRNRPVGADDLRSSPRSRNGERNRARPGAQIHDARIAIGHQTR